MQYQTRFSLGDRIYAIGQPSAGCNCQGCTESPLHAPKWNVLGVDVNNLERFDPLTVEAVMILPGEDEAPYGVYYAVREMPGELLPEEHCYLDLHEAGIQTEVLNARECAAVGYGTTQ